MALSYAVSQATLLLHLTELLVYMNRTESSYQNESKVDSDIVEFNHDVSKPMSDQTKPTTKESTQIKPGHIMLEVQCKLLNRTNPDTQLMCAEKIYCSPSSPDTGFTRITCLRTGQLLNTLKCSQISHTSMGADIYLVYDCLHFIPDQRKNWWIGVTLLLLVLIIVGGIACHIFKYSQRNQRKKSSMSMYSQRMSYGSVSITNATHPLMVKAKRPRNMNKYVGVTPQTTSFAETHDVINIE